MKRAIVRYTVRAECAAENERLVAAVFDALQREQPKGMRYGAFKFDDGRGFLHFISYEGDDVDALRSLPAFQEFLAGVRDRCEIPPETTTLHEIGSYQLVGPYAAAAH
jgi:hypothetical protein